MDTSKKSYNSDNVIRVTGHSRVLLYGQDARKVNMDGKTRLLENELRALKGLQSHKNHVPQLKSDTLVKTSDEGEERSALHMERIVGRNLGDYMGKQRNVAEGLDALYTSGTAVSGFLDKVHKHYEIGHADVNLANIIYHGGDESTSKHVYLVDWESARNFGSFRGKIYSAEGARSPEVNDAYIKSDNVGEFGPKSDAYSLAKSMEGLYTSWDLDNAEEDCKKNVVYLQHVLSAAVRRNSNRRSSMKQLYLGLVASGIHFYSTQGKHKQAARLIQQYTKTKQELEKSGEMVDANRRMEYDFLVAKSCMKAAEMIKEGPGQESTFKDFASSKNMKYFTQYFSQAVSLRNEAQKALVNSNYKLKSEKKKQKCQQAFDGLTENINTMRDKFDAHAVALNRMQYKEYLGLKKQRAEMKAAGTLSDSEQTKALRKVIMPFTVLNHALTGGRGSMTYQTQFSQIMDLYARAKDVCDTPQPATRYKVKYEKSYLPEETFTNKYNGSSYNLTPVQLIKSEEKEECSKLDMLNHYRRKLKRKQQQLEANYEANNMRMPATMTRYINSFNYLLKREAEKLQGKEPQELSTNYQGISGVFQKHVGMYQRLVEQFTGKKPYRN